MRPHEATSARMPAVVVFFSVYCNDFSVAHEISAKLASSASVVLKMPLTW